MYKVNERIENVYRVKPMQGRADFLRLDMNESPSGLPDEFVQSVLQKITPSLLAMYPETDKLVAALAAHLQTADNQIALTNGSDEAIKTIFEIFAEPGKNLVTVYPTFEMYGVYAALYGMNHVKIDYTDDFRVSFADFYEAIDETTKIVAVLNPNNPIGTIFTETEVISIIQKAQRLGAIVIIDEAYHYFYADTFLSLVDMFDNVILLRTFSKLCSLAGCRIGYAVANPHFIELINKARSTYGVNCVGVQFATEILAQPSLMEQLIAQEKEGKTYVLTQLTRQAYAHFSGNGNYIFIKPNKEVASVKQLLYEHKILIKTYANHLLSPYIRITTGDRRVMEKFVEIFMEIDRKE